MSSTFDSSVILPNGRFSLDQLVIRQAETAATYTTSPHTTDNSQEFPGCSHVCWLLSNLVTVGHTAGVDRILIQGQHSASPTTGFAIMPGGKAASWNAIKQAQGALITPWMRVDPERPYMRMRIVFSGTSIQFNAIGIGLRERRALANEGFLLPVVADDASGVY